eukprot:TRINITY_DN10914_c0_g3_i4.p1 TRINITY_DN10914_c0_g3~~TRINITY_DN10914_c0_g3_i4.p1  ORF type:complete len:184 (+),score=18.25 TRINITY_DN10914_c0_g3_i4:411-962(+)
MAAQPRTKPFPFARFHVETHEARPPRSCSGERGQLVAHTDGGHVEAAEDSRELTIRHLNLRVRQLSWDRVRLCLRLVAGRATASLCDGRAPTESQQSSTERDLLRGKVDVLRHRCKRFLLLLSSEAEAHAHAACRANAGDAHAESAETVRLLHLDQSASAKAQPKTRRARALHGASLCAASFL